MATPAKLQEEVKKLPGQTIEIISTASGLQIGTKLKISHAQISGSYLYVTPETGGQMNLLLTWYRYLAQTREELTKEEKELNKKLEEIRNKQEYLAETGQNEFNEKEFKVYGILKEMKNKKHGDSDLSMAKAIAQLI